MVEPVIVGRGYRMVQSLADESRESGWSGGPRSVVRRHDQVLKVLSGHVHRLIQTSWACSLWVGPSTSISVAVDLDPSHDPAETAEPPTFSLHAHTGPDIVWHLVPIGAAAQRSPNRAERTGFITWVPGVQPERTALRLATRCPKPRVLEDPAMSYRLRPGSAVRGSPSGSGAVSGNVTPTMRESGPPTASSKCRSSRMR
jgi:3',5'-cyclic AMP phosphodiesterase CpdA